MPVDSERCRLTFKRLDRQLTKLAEKPAPDSVHRFRTFSRRVETILRELAPRLRGNDRKLLKLLSRVRKRAGRVRDLDVQIAALRSLKIPQEPGRKTQLLRALMEERSGGERKLSKTLNKEKLLEARKRLRRSSNKLRVSKNTDPLALAVQRVSQLNVDSAPPTEETLHQYRIAGKRARYLAELADKDRGSRRFIQLLKHMQDTLGDWHDWQQLTLRADDLFKGVQGSALLAALHNVTQAKFRQGVEVLTQTRSALAVKKPVQPQAIPARKPPAQASRSAAAVA